MIFHEINNLRLWQVCNWEKNIGKCIETWQSKSHCVIFDPLLWVLGSICRMIFFPLLETLKQIDIFTWMPETAFINAKERLSVPHTSTNTKRNSNETNAIWHSWSQSQQMERPNASLINHFAEDRKCSKMNGMEMHEGENENEIDETKQNKSVYG